MFQKIYSLFLSPRQKQQDIRSRELVLNSLLFGTALVLASVMLLLVVNLFIGHRDVIYGILVTLFVSPVVFFLYWLSRSGHYRVSAWFLVVMYFLLASSLTLKWGVAIPMGVLLHGLVIVLAGILIGPRFSLYAVAVIILFMTLVQLGSDKGILHPDNSWIAVKTGMDDVLGFGIIYFVLGLVSWLFNYRMETSLHAAEQAESELSKQKVLLETTVKQRTSELQAAQLEKVRQMYRFAELGQLSTALLHDLANHLATLSVDIENIKGQTNSRAMGRIRRSIRYIGDMVIRVRDQLHGHSNVRFFSISAELDSVVQMLAPRARAVGVNLVWQPPANKKILRCRGEPIRFRQLMANLITNGIDAYNDVGSRSKKRDVKIEAVATKAKGGSIVISVDDWGKGIAIEDRSRLFEPFYSTKQTGMGMGLFIAKQVVEEHLLGTIIIDNSKNNTCFVITLPLPDV